MKNVIKKLSIGILALSFSLSFGQKIDANAKTILDDIYTYYKSKKNNYFKFVYSKRNENTEKTEPGFFYSSGDKYKLKIMNIEQLFDGKKVYNIDHEDQEITIAKPNSDSKKIFLSPLNYIDSYKNGYTVQYMGKKNIGKIYTDYVKMTPIKNNGIKYVNLFINSTKKQVIKLEQYSENNEITTIEISNYIEHQNLSPSIFKFDKANYKNYLITEL